LTGAPELTVEVLSNTEKDKRSRDEVKTLFHSRFLSIDADREQQLIEVYRREDAILKKAMIFV